jgi:hypothetical protein
MYSCPYTLQRVGVFALFWFCAFHHITSRVRLIHEAHHSVVKIRGFAVFSQQKRFLGYCLLHQIAYLKLQPMCPEVWLLSVVLFGDVAYHISPTPYCTQAR